MKLPAISFSGKPPGAAGGAAERDGDCAGRDQRRRRRGKYPERILLTLGRKEQCRDGFIPSSARNR